MQIAFTKVSAEKEVPVPESAMNTNKLNGSWKHSNTKLLNGFIICAYRYIAIALHTYNNSNNIHFMHISIQ